jgi:hypothetical protein
MAAVEEYLKKLDKELENVLEKLDGKMEGGDPDQVRSSEIKKDELTRKIQFGSRWWVKVYDIGQPISHQTYDSTSRLPFLDMIEKMPKEVGVFLSSNRFLPEKPETKAEGLVGMISVLDGLSDHKERADKVSSYRRAPYPQRLRPFFQCEELVDFLSTIWKIPSLRWGSLFYPDVIKEYMQRVHGGVRHFILSFQPQLMTDA